MRVDWLKACYETTAVVERGGSPQPIRWYFLTAEGPCAPPGIIRSRYWIADPQADPDFGEVLDSPKPFVDGSAPPAGPGCPRWPGIAVPCIGMIWPAALTVTWPDAIVSSPFVGYSVPLTWDPAQELYLSGVVAAPPGLFFATWELTLDPCGVYPLLEGVGTLTADANPFGVQAVWKYSGEPEPAVPRVNFFIPSGQVVSPFITDAGVPEVE